MRDVAMFLVLAVALVYSIRLPWIGILVWTWVSIMNPHTYGYWLSTFPVAASVVVCTLLGVLVQKDAQRALPVDRRETWVFMALMLWFCITLPFSFTVEGSYDQWKKVMKIDFMILVAMFVLHSKKHIELLVWALVVSIGFYGVKGGIFTIATGGAFRVWGPFGTYIEGNNEIALAMIIVIPLMRYLHMRSSNVWLKRGLLAAMLLTAAAAIGSQSRGALLAIIAMGAVLWWRSNNKAVTLVAIVSVAGLIYGFMPDSWFSRMDTIGEYKSDASAMGRINAWWMAFNLAKANFFGGGFNIYNPEVFGRYAPDPTDVHAAHSIYFQILGEHGFVGLFLFLLLWLMTWASAGNLRKVGARAPETRWLADLGAMCQVSMAGYAVGGAFLSLAYFDLPYNIMAIVVLGQSWLHRQAWKIESQADAAGDTAPGRWRWSWGGHR